MQYSVSEFICEQRTCCESFNVKHGLHKAK